MLTVYAAEEGVRSVVSIAGDSVQTLWSQLDSWGPESFLHVDPYALFAGHPRGRTYFDLVMKAIQRGIRTMVWYGYDTIADARALGLIFLIPRPGDETLRVNGAASIVRNAERSLRVTA